MRPPLQLPSKLHAGLNPASRSTWALLAPLAAADVAVRCSTWQLLAPPLQLLMYVMEAREDVEGAGDAAQLQGLLEQNTAVKDRCIEVGAPAAKHWAPAACRHPGRPVRRCCSVVRCLLCKDIAGAHALFLLGQAALPHAWLGSAHPSCTLLLLGAGAGGRLSSRRPAARRRADHAAALHLPHPRGDRGQAVRQLPKQRMARWTPGLWVQRALPPSPLTASDAPSVGLR